jgi:hypothetical protein
MFQMSIKYINISKIFQMSVKYTYKHFQDLPELGFLFWKYTIWQPWHKWEEYFNTQLNCGKKKKSDFFWSTTLVTGLNNFAREKNWFERDF